MKRRLFKLALFLIFGAIVNFLVAWACVLLVPLAEKPGEFFGRTTEVEVMKQSTYAQRAFGRTRMNVLVYIWDEAEEGPGNAYIDDWQRSYSYELTGWPMHSLTCFNPNEFLVRIRGNLKQRAPSAKPIINGIRLKHELRITNKQMAYWRALPYQPIWQGFVVNSIFYSIFVWIVALLLYTSRLNIRLKRGRCLKCNYNLRGTFKGGCPECGWGREGEA